MAELVVKIDFPVAEFNSMIEKFKEENHDFVEVVRCKDCVLSVPLPPNDVLPGMLYCKAHDILMEKQDFCSKGILRYGGRDE